MSNKAQIDDEEDENFKKIKEGFTVNYMQIKKGNTKKNPQKRLE